MRKKVLLLFLVSSLILVHGCGTGTGPEGAVPESSILEDYEEDSGAERVVIENNIVDYSGEYTEEEQQEIRQECLEVIEAFCSTAFTMDSDTQDFTDDLMELTCNDFDSLDTEAVKNIYTLLHALGNTSTYQSYDCRQFLIKTGTDYDQTGAMGFAVVEMENDDFEAGKYAIYCQFDLIKVNGDWKIARQSISTVFDADSYTAYAPSDESASLTLAGNLAGQLDFANMEGYLTDYNYGEEFPGEG